MAPSSVLFSRRLERDVLMVVRVVVWVETRVVDGTGDAGRDERGEEGREVWIPISRWKSSVGSSSLSLLSSSSPFPDSL